MDAFYAAVEEADNPRLKGHPVIVGGRKRHGIVTTANYEARKFGIHSAMPIFMARQRCPQGYYIAPRMARYQEVSREVFKILYSITDLVEPLSIDEAYLDISRIDRNPLDIVKDIKHRVLRETGLTMSVGISYNKFLAKLASEWNKPNGLKIITRDMIPEILLPLPVNSVYGIGKISKKKLNDIGIYIIEDLMRLSEEFLVELFGKSGRETYYRIRGIDNRVVETNRERKSIGTERTFKGTRDIELLKDYLHSYALEIESSLERKGLQARTIILKVKDDKFRTQTRSRTMPSHITSAKDIYEIGLSLFEEIELTKDLRLIGLTASNLIGMGLEQLSLFDEQ